jgi:aminotransferase
LTDLGFSYGHPGGAFYIYTNVASSGLPAPEFCERLLRETGVMVFPGTMFGDTSTDYIRISYLQPLPLIEKAMERIAAFTRKTRAAA